MSVSNLEKHIKNAFDNAEKEISKVSYEILTMEGMTGKKTRHFYNNLLNIEDARYLEIGVWKGSSICSAIYKNKIKAVCIDNWNEFSGPKDEFIKNINKYRGINDVTFIEQDCFTVDVSKLPKFNIYMYDGCHLKESHYKALVHYYNCLDDIFIYIVDDWNWKDVRDGTFDAIKDLNLKLLYSIDNRTTNDDTHPTYQHMWHNGIYIAILQK